MGRKKKRKKKNAETRSRAADAAAAPTASTPLEAAPPPPPPPPSEGPPPPTSQPPVTAAPADVIPPQPSSPTKGSEEAVEDLDADLDEDDASYESLVALVAGLPEEDAPAGASRSAGARAERGTDAPGEVEVVDLDDDGSGEAIERLIAKAVVGAPKEEIDEEPEPPVIDLDADEPRSPTRAPAVGAKPTASEEAARLALAAARGALDEEDVPSFSVDEDEVSTPEARARLLAEAMAHAEHQEARYRVPTDTGSTRRWKAVGASLVFLLAGWVAVVPPGWVRPEPPAQLNAAARARSLRTALLLQAQQVEAFRVETQRLPTSLDEVRARLPGMAYARSGNRAYQLVAYEPDGDAIVYDSSDPAPAFRVPMSAWLAVEDAR